MIRITALHGTPHDPDAFDRYYRDVHTPIVQRIPGVRNIRYGRTITTFDGGAPPYYLVSDVEFDDRDSLDRALASDEMNEAIADVPNFATGGVTIMLCEYDDFPPATGA